MTAAWSPNAPKNLQWCWKESVGLKQDGNNYTCPTPLREVLHVDRSVSGIQASGWGGGWGWECVQCTPMWRNTYMSTQRILRWGSTFMASKLAGKGSEFQEGLPTGHCFAEWMKSSTGHQAVFFFFFWLLGKWQWGDEKGPKGSLLRSPQCQLIPQQVDYIFPLPLPAAILSVCVCMHAPFSSEIKSHIPINLNSPWGNERAIPSKELTYIFCPGQDHSLMKHTWRSHLSPAQGWLDFQHLPSILPTPPPVAQIAASKPFHSICHLRQSQFPAASELFRAWHLLLGRYCSLSICQVSRHQKSIPWYRTWKNPHP